MSGNSSGSLLIERLLASDEDARMPQEAKPLPAESVESMRRRARHRLLGAAILLLVGVIGFPLLFETQPRPIAVDIPIEIPRKDGAPPLVLPAPAPALSSAPSPQDAGTHVDRHASACASLLSGPSSQVSLVSMTWSPHDA